MWHDRLLGETAGEHLWRITGDIRFMRGADYAERAYAARREEVVWLRASMTAEFLNDEIQGIVIARWGAPIGYYDL